MKSEDRMQANEKAAGPYLNTCESPSGRGSGYAGCTRERRNSPPGRSLSGPIWNGRVYHFKTKIRQTCAGFTILVSPLADSVDVMCRKGWFSRPGALHTLSHIFGYLYHNCLFFSLRGCKRPFRLYALWRGNIKGSVSKACVSLFCSGTNFALR